MPLPVSASQQRLIRLVAKGYTDSEIVRKMGLSRNQLQRAFSELCDQLNVTNRLELMLLIWSFDGHISAPGARTRGDVDATRHSLKPGWSK